MSAWAFYVPEDRKIVPTNQAKFSKHEFPFRNRKMIDQFLSDNSTDILYQHASNVKWEPYNKLHVANYDKVHYDTKSDVVVLKVLSKENTFTRAIQGKWLSDKVALGDVIHRENKTPVYAFNAGVKHRSLKGLNPRINPDKPSRNFGDAMKALDKQAWAAAYNSEYLGFKQRDVFKLVKPAQGVRIHDTLTRLEYKEDNSEFLKCKVCLCARGDQLLSEVSFKETDLYAPVLKAAEARLLLALAAAEGAKVIKTDTKQHLGTWTIRISGIS